MWMVSKTIVEGMVKKTTKNTLLGTTKDRKNAMIAHVLKWYET